MGWFKWKGVKMPNFVILENTPSPVRAERVTSVMDMPNNVPIIYQTNGYKTTPIPINIGFRPGVIDRNFFNQYGGYNFSTDAEITSLGKDEILNLQFDSIYGWLQGAGTLTFSNDDDKYYNAVCNAQIVPERLSRRLRKLPVQFTCMPFRYSLDNEVEEVTLRNYSEESYDGNIQYDGSQPSEPTIKVSGSGEIGIYWGGNFVKLLNVSNFATIDVPTRRVYDSEGHVILNAVEGDITKLRVTNGMHVIIDKTCTKLEVKKNTRWR